MVSTTGVNQMKKTPLLVLATAVLMTLGACSPATKTSRGDGSEQETVSSYETDHSSIYSSEEEVLFNNAVSNNPHDAEEIYELFAKLGATGTYRQKIFTKDESFVFTYHSDRYIVQEGEGFNNAAIALKNYKKGGTGDVCFESTFKVKEDGHKEFTLGRPISLIDWSTFQIVGHETSLKDYNIANFYNEYTVKYNEVLTGSEANTFELKFKQQWYDLGNGNRTFMAFVSQLIAAGEYFGAGRLRSIKMYYNTDENLVIEGYINSFDDDDLHLMFVTVLEDVGTARDADMDAFLASDAVKISDKAVNRNDVANALGSSLSTTTTVTAYIDGKEVLVGDNNLDFDENVARLYGINGDTHYHNQDGRFVRDYIDGQNEVSWIDTGYPYSQLVAIADRFDEDDWREVGENKYRYYGADIDTAFLDFSETPAPGGWLFQDVVLETSGGKMTKVTATTETEYAVLDSGEEAEVSYKFETKIVPNRSIPDLKPYARIDDQATRLEKALDYINDPKTEYSVYGIETSDDPEFDATGCYREMTYTNEFILEDYHYYRTHMDANANVATDEIHTLIGDYYIKDSSGKTTGVVPFKVKDGNPVAKRPVQSADSKTYRRYYCTPSAEVFDYNPSTRTYTTKDDVGYYAAIYVGKAFPTAADNFMVGVSITLTEDLSKVEKIVYHESFVYDGVEYGTADGILTFNYNIDKSEMLSKLQAMPDYTYPTKWSDSECGEKIVREFNDYYKGCVDHEGKPLDIDNVPYLYDPTADYYWAPVQFTIAKELWLLNDAGSSDKDLMKKLIEKFESDDRWTYQETDQNGARVYVDGDMYVRVLPNTVDGLWFGKTVNL